MSWFSVRLALAWRPQMVQSNPLFPNVAAVTGRSFKHRGLRDILATSYVVDTLEAVLWALPPYWRLPWGRSPRGEPRRRRRYHRRRIRAVGRGILRSGGHPAGMTEAAGHGGGDRISVGQSLRAGKPVHDAIMCRWPARAEVVGRLPSVSSLTAVLSIPTSYGSG